MNLGLDSATFKRLMWSLSMGLLLSFSGMVTSGCFGTGGKKDKGDEMTDEANAADDGEKKKSKKKGKKKAKKKEQHKDGGEGGESDPGM